MELILTVFQIVAPVFILAAIGFTWVKIGWSYEIEFVTRLAMTLSVPALIFVALMKANISADTLSNLFLSSLIAYLFLALIFWITGKIFKLNMATYWAPLIFGNTGNLGLPLAMFAFGEVGLGYAVVVFAVMAIGSFSIGVWMVSGGGSINKVFKEPMVLGNFIGSFVFNSGLANAKMGYKHIGIIGTNGNSFDVNYTWCCISSFENKFNFTCHNIIDIKVVC